MKLGEFLNTVARSAPTKPVRFKVIGRSTGSPAPLVADVEAVMIFISEEERAACKREAEKYIKETYKNETPSPDALTDEIVYQTLFKVLRDSSSDNFIAPFAESVLALRKSLVKKVATELYAQYFDFIYEEFPDHISTEDFEKMVAEAEKKSLAALLSEYGLSKIVQVLPSLANRSGK